MFHANNVEHLYINSKKPAEAFIRERRAAKNFEIYEKITRAQVFNLKAKPKAKPAPKRKVANAGKGSHRSTKTKTNPKK